MRIGLTLVGLLALGLAVAGALLPGLPTTPFLLVALWAFSKSNQRLYAWVQTLPILKTALTEARRFEERRAMRLSLKIISTGMAWGSVTLIAATTGWDRPVLLSLVVLAAISCTVFVLWIPTDNSPV